MELVNLDDVLSGKETLALADGVILCAKTGMDGYTGTYDGNHYFQLKAETVGEGEETATNYRVVPVVFDFENKSAEIGNPIIITDGNVLFHIVGTNRDAFKYPFTYKEEIKDDGDLVNKVILAFIDFARDEYRIGTANIFLAERPSWVKP